jgi:exonuclease I
MVDADIKEISKFLNYFQKETDRGAALIGASMIDSRLERILDLYLLNNSSKNDLFEGPNSVLGTFSAKIKMCHLLGFITDKENNEITIIRKIRNEFAHKLEDLSFDDQRIHDLCMNLQASTPGDLKKGKKYRELYVNSVVLTSLALWYRPEYINKRNRISKIEWDYCL